MRLTKIVVYLTLLFWPINLYLNNSLQNFTTYCIPPLLVIISFWVYKKGLHIYPLPLIAIPLFSPKLALFPIIFLVADLLVNKKNWTRYVMLLVSLALLFFVRNQFIGQTIFPKDYEAQQTLIRDSHLYPTVFTARLFNNKAEIISSKFFDNFFTLADPNNYFFGNAPRQISGNQNLAKFPFLALILLLIGIFFVSTYKSLKFIIIIFIASFVSLSVIKVFDGNDFILWFPISLLLIFSINITSKFKYSSYFYLVYLVFGFVQLIQIFVSK